MLVKLLPEQITEHWGLIKASVEQALPPVANEAYDKMNRILEAVLLEKMQCWASYREEEDKIILEAIVITTLMNDMCSSIKSLMIYSFYAFGTFSQAAWENGFETLSKWGKANGCNRIVAYTDVERIKEVIKELGGEARFTFISLPL